ncbi:uncharacterized protein LOC132929481 [Rhopalosiphum padi]|uniref:uncharacterized protein LOC132929481 n=1 Tax=Rhopalosiphum padi TaxID=40932 RepID=UPI00298D7AF7|nr:uncharacterized protein LOC132929481 [Rhopalosiphum padi]
MVEYSLMKIEMVSNTSTKNNGEPKEIKTDTTIFNWEGNASLLIQKAEKNYIPTTDAALLFIYIHKFYADQHEFFKSVTSDPNSFCVAFGFESTRECLMDPSNYKTIAEEDV